MGKSISFFEHKVNWVMVYEIIADKQQFSCGEAKVQEVVQSGLWTEVNV